MRYKYSYSYAKPSFMTPTFMQILSEKILKRVVNF